MHLLELIYSLSLSLQNFVFNVSESALGFFVQFQMIQGFQVLVRAARGVSTYHPIILSDDPIISAR